MRRRSVLLVEDDETVALGLGWFLEDAGYAVVLQHTGREAFGLVRHTRPHAVIIDVSLPDADGLMIAHLVRDNWPDLPIVVTSGYDRSDEAVRLLARGAAAYLQKPFEPAELIRTLDTLLG